MSQFVSSAEKHIILLCYVYRARSLEHHDERGVAFFPTPTQVGCLFIGAMFFIWCLVDNIGLFQVTERSGLMAMDGRASRRPRERAGGGVDGARDTRVGVDIDVVSRQFRRRRLELTPPNHPVGRWWKAKKEKEKKKKRRRRHCYETFQSANVPRRCSDEKQYCQQRRQQQKGEQRRSEFGMVGTAHWLALFFMLARPFFLVQTRFDCDHLLILRLWLLRPVNSFPVSFFNEFLFFLK